MTESAYYELGALWQGERYDEADQQHRFSVTASLIPEGTSSLVDIGAGQGAFLGWLEGNRPGIRLAGVERAQSAIDAAVCRTTIQPASIEHLPFPDHSFDVATALEVLEHLPHGVYDAGRAELARVAATIIVSVPYAERRTHVVCPECGCRFHPNYHQRSFDPATFGSLFEGFRLERREIIDFDDYVGGLAIRWAYRTLRGGTSEMQPGNLCPQCGYRQATAGAARVWARRRVKSRLPTVRRPRWLLGRFVSTS